MTKRAILAACVGLAVVCPDVDARARLGARYVAQSTAYAPCSSGSIMANGQRVHWGAVANNVLPLGTKIRMERPVRTRRPDGRVVNRRFFRVKDRIGWGSQLDIWMPFCQDAIQWGRRTVAFRVVLPRRGR